MTNPPGSGPEGRSDDEWSAVPPDTGWPFADPSTRNPSVPPYQPYQQGPYQQTPHQPVPHQPVPHQPVPYQPGPHQPGPVGPNQPGPNYPYPYHDGVRPQTDGRAIAALVCGLLSFPLAVMCSGLLLPLPVIAVVLGILSRRDIRSSGGRSAGMGMAVAGIVFGAIGIVLMLVMLAILGREIAR